MAVATIVSFRLGGADGVSVVAGHWVSTLERLGWRVVTVGGAGTVDRLVRGLELGAADPPDAAELERALEDCDVVVVENLLTIPMNLPASRVTARVLAGRPAVLHHHDPPWQRERFSHITELPATDPAWVHVTINERTRKEFGARGLEARTIWNAFDVHEPDGDRDRARRALGVDSATRLVVHPVRAIARKNVPAAIRMTETLGGTYWLVGAAEEGYADTLDGILADATCPVLRAPWEGRMADVYAAADLVAFPSTWEGFGNPPVEAAIHRRPVAVSHYPVAEEVRRFGFEWFDPEDVVGIDSFLTSPDEALLDRNRAVAVEWFLLERLERDLAVLFGPLDPQR